MQLFRSTAAVRHLGEVYCTNVFDAFLRTVRQAPREPPQLAVATASLPGDGRRLYLEWAGVGRLHDDVTERTGAQNAQ